MKPSLRETIEDWYKKLPIKPNQRDRLFTVTPTELEQFIDTYTTTMIENIRSDIIVDDERYCVYHTAAKMTPGVM